MSTVLRYLANRSPNPAENPDIAAHRTRMLRISETCVACGACGVAGEGGAECNNATMRQCSKPRSTGERGGAQCYGVAVSCQAKAGAGVLRLRGGQAGCNPGLGAAGDVVDRKALGLQMGLQGFGGLSAAATQLADHIDVPGGV